MKVRAHVYVTGRVQGVFFRHFTQVQAEKRNVKGWIKNLPDRRVEAVFEGEKEDVEALIEFCHHGPPGAKVKNVEVRWENYTGEFNGFEIWH